MENQLNKTLSNISNPLNLNIPSGTYSPGTVLNINNQHVVVERYIAEGLKVLKKGDLLTFI